MHCVYLLECSDGTYYTGYSQDVLKRLDAHNKGAGARYTRGRRPVRLIGVREFSTQVEAMRAERLVKTMDKRSKSLYFSSSR